MRTYVNLSISCKKTCFCCNFPPLVEISNFICTPQPDLPGIYLIVTLIEALQPSFVVIAVLNFQCTAWACSTSRNSDSTIRIIDDQMSLSSFLSTVLCGFIIRIITHNAINLRKDISNYRTKTKGLDSQYLWIHQQVWWKFTHRKRRIFTI